ncbi:hypothetical protein J7J23_00915 [bacterium]|nr:hypothetical protein [bacterium]
MQYYHDLITEKSFDILKSAKRKYKFILIGGWAVFLYTRSLKSKDIDIIVDYEELSKLKEDFKVTKNSRLKKYEIKTKGIDIDIYLPHFSDLVLPCQEIEKFTITKQGFALPIPEVLLILKQGAFLSRKESSKGIKDKIDIFSLLSLENFDFLKYEKILKKYKKEKFVGYLIDLLKETFEIKELKLSRHKMSRLKKEILKKVKKGT